MVRVYDSERYMNNIEDKSIESQVAEIVDRITEPSDYESYNDYKKRSKVIVAEFLKLIQQHSTQRLDEFISFMKSGTSDYFYKGDIGRYYELFLEQKARTDVTNKSDIELEEREELIQE